MSHVIHTGSNLDVLPTLPDNSIDAIVTDPPYGLEFMGQEWDAPWKQGGYGFSKPGIGDRPTKWPSFTSTNKFGAINPTCKKCKGRLRGAKKCFCDNPEWKPIGKRRNPENESLPSDVTSSGMANQMQAFQRWYHSVAVQMFRVLKPGGHIISFGGSRTYHRMASALDDAGFEIRDQMMWVYGSGFPKSHNISKALDKSACAEREVIGKAYGAGNSNTENLHGLGLKLTYDLTVPATAAAKKWDGWGTALKPAHEPICLARKPLDGTVADNVRKWGVGGLNIDGCRVGDGTGRFPANLMHDGSQEVLELFPGEGEQTAARFFYCPKASKADRDEGCEGLDDKVSGSMRGEESREGKPTNHPIRKNNHPTVKPTELMRYLCRLITPPGGTVLDPFNGSGSTGKAAVLEGFNYIGIEMNPEYVAISEARIKAATEQ